MCHKIESVHGQSLICVTRNVLRMIKAHFLAVSVLLLARARDANLYTLFQSSNEFHRLGIDCRMLHLRTVNQYSAIVM